MATKTETANTTTKIGTDYHSLPLLDGSAESERKLSAILRQHEDSFFLSVTHEITRMLTYNLYLGGFRNFNLINFETGDVEIGSFEDWGSAEYVHPEVVTSKEAEVRRLEKLDCMPLVSTRSEGLHPKRERAVAQAVLDAVVDPDQLEDIKSQLFNMMVVNGGAGLYGTIEDHPSIGVGADIQVVPPWEVFFWPQHTIDNSKGRGIGWRRFVPLSFLRQKFGDRKINAIHPESGKAHNRMKIREIPWGEQVQAQAHIRRNQMSGGGTPPNSTNKIPQRQEIAELSELWLYGPRQTVSRYIVRSGDAILMDIDLSNQVAYCPLQYRRYADNGSAYGIGKVGLMMHPHRQIERMCQHLYDFVSELDRFGFVALPSGSFDPDQVQDVGHGLRILLYELESFGRTSVPQPTNIQPNSPGPFAGQVLATAVNLADRIAPTPQIESGESPGRVDSASGLMFLAEQSNNNIALPAKSVNTLFGNAYRNILQETIQRIMVRGADETDNRFTVPLVSTSLDMLGVVIKRADGKGFVPDTTPPETETSFAMDAGGYRLSLRNNPVPNPSALGFGVKSVSPRHSMARKREVIESWQMGMIEGAQSGGGFLELAIINHREGLDLPLGNDVLSHTIRRVELQILVLFNDGKTPGPLFDNTHQGNRELAMRLVQEAMATPEFAVSSEEVQRRFTSWYVDLQNENTINVQGITPTATEAAASHMATMMAQNRSGSPLG